MSVLGDVVAKLEAKGLNVRQLLEEAGVPLLSIQEAAAVAEEAEAKQAEQMAGAAADAKDATDATNKELP
jgi:hypothetical protein